MKDYAMIGALDVSKEISDGVAAAIDLGRKDILNMLERTLVSALERLRTRNSELVCCRGCCMHLTQQ
jgi:hypothetical protein